MAARADQRRRNAGRVNLRRSFAESILSNHATKLVITALDRRAHRYANFGHGNFYRRV